VMKTRNAHLWKVAVLMGLGMLVLVGRAEAGTLWDESVSGDLSGDQSAPNAFTLSPGTNAVIGSLRTSSSADSQDWITLTVPGGMSLSAVVLKSYSSTDQQGFTGVQDGTNFVGSTVDPASYLGYSHFGTGPGNIGQDILPTMSTVVGAQGFTPPLGSGPYTFLIQQTGSAATSYEFDYVVVPEPTTVTLVALGFGVILLRRRRSLKAPRAF
jgi:hypothetical protein